MTRSLLDLIFPVRCAGCGVPGPPWCAGCQSGAGGPYAVARALCATGPPMYALSPYQGAYRTVLLAYKERGRRDLAGPLGRRLAMAVPWLPGARAGPDGCWWLVPAPSRAPESRRRGGPHMLRLARRCAAALAGSGHASAVAPALALDARAGDSVGLAAGERLANLTGRVRLYRPGAPPPGTPVVLLDDVVTTGATVAACTAVLAAAELPVTAVLAVTATA